MRPVDVKISLNNEINVIRMEDGKQKSIFQFLPLVFCSLPPPNSAVSCLLPFHEL